MQKSVYIVEAKRTAIGRYGGTLLSLSPTDVMAIVIRYITTKLPEIKNKIDEVIVGNVLSAGIGQNPARIALIKAGLSNKIPAFTVNKVCGSGLKSVVLGVNAIQNEDADLIFAGGMESMSRCPYYLDGYRFGIKFGDQSVRDGMIYDGLSCSLIGEHMGITAENLAKKFQISREEQDEYAFQSHQKAINAIDNKFFQDDIIPVEIEGQREFNFLEDEQPRRDTSLEKLLQLKPAFKKNGTVTAGNSSSLNDGAGLVLLASEKAVKRYKLKPKAVIRSYASKALNPSLMGLGAYFAAKKSLEKAGLNKSKIDLWEINEAFASQSLAVLKLLDLDRQKVNVRGGAIAFGHPIGATGTIILTTLLSELQRRKLQYGLVSLCIGGGQGISIVIERV